MAKRVIISGGGTGGHIFPAIAIANALRRHDPSVEILFVGAQGRMEMEKVPQSGYKIVGLPIAGFQRKALFKNILLPIKLVASLLMSGKIIKEFKPDAAVGVGGYASAPLLYVAGLLNIPYLIQEQNSFAGITNRQLSKKAKKICVAFHGMERFFPKEKLLLTGNPIRKESVDISNKREEALGFFGLDANKRTVLVTGGSLGAGTLNKSLMLGYRSLLNEDIQIIWQTGKYYFGEVKSEVDSESNNELVVTEFLSRMDLAYAAADIVVSRAGAGTIAELCVVKKPVVLVPSPNVSEDHQTKNAMALVEQNAAVVVKDSNAESDLIETVKALLTKPDVLRSLSENIGKLGLPEADDVIAKEVIKLIYGVE